MMIKSSENATVIAGIFGSATDRHDRNGLEPTVPIDLLAAVKSIMKHWGNGPAHGHRVQRLQEAEVEARDLR